MCVQHNVAIAVLVCYHFWLPLHTLLGDYHIAYQNQQ
uniref:Uncharacterized protein n=1 Tax=Anguilla anguilla TaxID=7936 RepID=A0A0E9UBU0_ANGAN